MDIRPIRSDSDHAEALREIERLWGAEPGTAAGDKLDVLATLVEAYENNRWPTDPVTPVDILRTAIRDDGRTQAELAEVLGSRSRASEILAGKRSLNLEAARKISAAWKIPIQLLVAAHEGTAA
jgi:HTH-type transcriptional regulator/antitoxin HigA